MFNCLWPCGLQSARLLCPWDSPAKNTGVGCQALLQGIFLTQRLTPGVLCLLHWQKDALPLAPPGKAHLYVNSYNKLTFKSKSFVSEILFEGFIFVQVIFLCFLTTAMLTSLSLSFFFFSWGFPKMYNVWGLLWWLYG